MALPDFIRNTYESFGNIQKVYSKQNVMTTEFLKF